MILAGDVGGTNVRLALGRPAGDGVEVVAERSYGAEDHVGLAPILRAFVAEAAGGSPVERACLGVAGPIVGGAARMTNLDWTFDEAGLSAALGGAPVELINDLVATAWGLDLLGRDQLETLAAGEAKGPTAALIAAGTGLGMAIATRVEGRRVVLPSEGGHASFSPRDDEEAALAAWLRERHGRASVERVVSGPGLREIYAFLRETGRAGEPAWLAGRLAASPDPSAAISDAGLEGEAEIAVEALRRFVAAYGGAAGDLALTALALGGVYVSGGIAPQILPALTDGRFVEAFRAKEPLRELLDRVPVHVIRDPGAALLGAARCATLSGQRARTPER